MDGPRGRTVVVTLAALALAGCGLVRSSDSEAETLTDGLVDRIWIAVEHPLPELPIVEFERAGSTGVSVDGDDTCNHATGPIGFDGNIVRSSDVATTAKGCTIPSVTFISPGAVFELDDDELVISNSLDASAPSTRYVAWDSLSPVQSDDVRGDHLFGVETITLSEGWPDPGWTEARRTDSGDLVVLTDDAPVRLDVIGPDEPARPTLEAFLGVVAGRTWVIDDPGYPSSRRPFVRFALSVAADGVPAAYGYDGCGRVMVEEVVHQPGVWTPDGDGWALSAPTSTSVADSKCDNPVDVVNATYALADSANLTVTTDDGAVHRLVDAAIRPAGEPHGPVAAMAGDWTVEPGGGDVVISTEPNRLTAGDCETAWSGDNNWIELEPAPCLRTTTSAESTLAAWITEGATLAVGVNADRTVLYLSRDLSIDTADTAVLRLPAA